MKLFNNVSFIFILCNMIFSLGFSYFKVKNDKQLKYLPKLNSTRSAVIQLFNWPFHEIKKELCFLRDIGISHVHVSPPQLSNPGAEWWARYQPDDLRKLVGPLGSETDFSQMMIEASRCEMQIIVDVVVNHMANYSLPDTELYFPLGCDRSKPSSWQDPTSCIYKPEHFHPATCIQNYSNTCEVLKGRICGSFPDKGLPDLKTGNCEENYDEHVFNIVKAYLYKLYDLGVKSFRWDAAKHMHPNFIKDVINDMPRDTWFYAEIIADHKPQFQWYSSINNLDFMDFPLTRSLLEAFSYNGWLSLLSHLHEKGKTLEPFQSVSFVTNHDVWGNADGLGYRFGGFEAARDELLAHLFVLGRGEGIPYLYSEIENGPSSLLRDENGQLLRGEQDNFVYYHRKPEIIAGLRFHNLTAGNNVHWQVEEQTHLLWTKGNHALMAINKSNTDWWVEWNPNWGLQFGDYYNLLENSEIKIDPKNVWIKVPARYALMLIKK